MKTKHRPEQGERGDGFRRRRAMLAALILLVGLGTAVSVYYRGFMKFNVGAIRTVGLQKAMNVSLFLISWSKIAEQLQPDETGFFGFDTENLESLDGFKRAMISFHTGDFVSTVEDLEHLIEERGPSEQRILWLALSYQRLGEAENCLAMLQNRAASDHGHSLGMCSLPLGRFHDREANTRKAVELFGQLLEQDSEDKLYRWLLNFSLMTLDGFPHEVPEQYRINSSFIDQFYGETSRRTAERYAHLVFEDQAQQLGGDVHDRGKGVAVEDFDRDGFLDIVTGGTFDPLRLLLNRGGASFEDHSMDSGLSEVTQAHIISTADYDNDGWPDLFVGSHFQPFVLLRNAGDGTFTDVTSESGLRSTEGNSMTWSSAWGDIDNDGDLDLFIGQMSVRIPYFGGIVGRPRIDSQLFINQGDGRFVDGTTDWGLRKLMHEQYFMGAAFGDYDDDGFVDLFLSTGLWGADSLLLHNEQGKSFKWVRSLERPIPGFTAAFVDVDHDGRLDLFHASTVPDARTSIENAIFDDEGDPPRYESGHSAILLQVRDGVFEEQRELWQGGMPIGTMGTSFGDLDNDGCLDFYLGTGGPESSYIVPNLMYIGEREGKRCTGRMTNISMLNGFGTVQKGHGIVFFDFDHDGDQDIYSSLGGLWPGDSWPNQLFVNQSTLENSWIKIRLRGRKTNHFGVGARIRVVAHDAEGAEIVRFYSMDHKTGFGSAPYLAHVGLLDAVEIHQIEVKWPASGCQKSYPGDLNALNLLDESECLEEA